MLILFLFLRKYFLPPRPSKMGTFHYYFAEGRTQAGEGSRVQNGWSSSSEALRLLL